MLDQVFDRMNAEIISSRSHTFSHVSEARRAAPPPVQARALEGLASASIALPVGADATTATQSAPVRGYRPELDAVRFCAFLLVFLHHVLPIDLHAAHAGRITSLLGERGWFALIALTNSFGIGLCLFFTLSAYLITDLLLTERAQVGTVSIRRFYARRILRIWPLYYLAIALALVWCRQLHIAAGGWWLASYLFFGANMYCALYGWGKSPINPLWSISIEEQFYLLWPWAMKLLSRRGLYIAAALFLLAANAALFYFGQTHARVDPTVWANTLVQFEMFAVGILLALLKRPRTGSTSAAFLQMAAGGLLWLTACFAFRARLANEAATSGLALIAGYALIALGCALVLRGFCVLGAERIPAWIAQLGKISYGLYVYHMFAIEGLRHLLGARGIAYRPWEPLVALALTILLAQISYRWIERPFLLLKRHFEALHTQAI